MRWYFSSILLLISLGLANDLPHPQEQQAWLKIQTRFTDTPTYQYDQQGKLIKAKVGKLKSHLAKSDRSKEPASFELTLDRHGHVVKVFSNRCDFSNEEIALFKDFQKLKFLHLWHNGKYNLKANHDPDYDGSGLIHLVSLSHLQEIMMSGGSLHNQGLAALGKLPHLKKLGIWHIHASNEGFKTLARSQTLEWLRICPNWIQTQNADLLKYLAECKSLKTLTFSKTHFKIDTLKDYFQQSSIKTFNMENALISSGDFAQLQKEFPELEIIWNRPEGLKALFEKFKWMPSHIKTWIPKESMREL